MATLNLTWTPCGSTSDGTYVYYGKLNVATGTPISGTGWTLYTGSPLSNGAGSVSISGLDDNVQYIVYTYCHCVAAGNGPLVQAGPVINYACATLTNISPSFNGVSYTLNIPNSANNAGTYITRTLVYLYDSTNSTILQGNAYNAPFTASINDSFSALSPSTNYNLRVVYSNTSGSLVNGCVNTPFTTSVACSAPTVTVNNPTATGFDVNWTPTTGGTFDIIVNGNAIATGLTTGPYTVTGQSPATTYQVNVRKNCTTGGNAVSTTQSITTSNANVNGVIAVNAGSTLLTNSTFPQGYKTLTMSVTFPTATTFPITLYFGQISNHGLVGGSSCNRSNGYDLFTLPTSPCASASESGFGPSTNLPWVINIPQGTTSFTTAVGSVYTTAGQGTYQPWSLVGPFDFSSTISNLYIRVNAPAGYSANFSIANGQNTNNINLHNV